MNAIILFSIKIRFKSVKNTIIKEQATEEHT